MLRGFKSHELLITFSLALCYNQVADGLAKSANCQFIVNVAVIKFHLAYVRGPN